MESHTTTIEEQFGTLPSDYPERGPYIPPLAPQKFCPFLSITGPKRLCDWRECGAAHLCRGG